MNPQEFKFDIPPELKSKFDSMVAACLKVLYSDVAKEELLSPVENPEQFPADLAESAMGLLKIVDDEFGNQLPRELMVPVGLYMVAEIADFNKQSGIFEATPEQIADAMEVFIAALFQASKQGAPA